MFSTIFNKALSSKEANILFVLMSVPGYISAKSGAVDYSWGADALAKAHDYTVTMMLYVQYMAFAFGAILSIIGALQIFFKMNTGEGDVTKSIMMLIGGILFLISAMIVFPAFFGYEII